jgi:hypothetical protein
MYSSTLPSTTAPDGGGWSTPRPGHFTPGKEPIPIVQEAGWVTGQVWKGAENPAPNGIRSPDRPARSKSLHRLGYPGPPEPMSTVGILAGVKASPGRETVPSIPLSAKVTNTRSWLNLNFPVRFHGTTSTIWAALHFKFYFSLGSYKNQLISTLSGSSLCMLLT